MPGHQRGVLRASILLAVALCVATAAAQDDCSTAVPVTVGLIAGSTTTLTTSTAASCGVLHNDIWFAWTATCTGTATATLCTPGTASFDAVLAAYDGSGGCGNLLPLACDDNTCGNKPQVSFPILAGMPYFIALGGVGSATGTFTLSLSCSSTVSNDECSGALPIGNGLTAGSNLGATNSPQTGSCGNIGSDVWYAYTAPCAGWAEATFCQPGTASFDTVIAVFDASTPCSNPTEIVCNDDTCVLRSKALFQVQAGAVYYIVVGGFGGMQGTFTLSLSCHPAPGNDDCTGAVPLALGANGPFSNQYATDGPPPGAGCPAGSGDVWFTFVPACSGLHRVDTCGAYDTVMSVHDACGASANVIACNDDGPAGSCAPGSAVSFTATAGTAYRVRVAGSTAASGSFSVNVAAVFDLVYSSPLGAGSIGFAIGGGPAGGTYLNVVTFNQGSFPNGAFYGLDVTPEEVFALINVGYPFLGTLDACGATSFPFVVAPFLSGTTIYSVALATDSTLTLPVVATAPVSATIP